MSDSLPAFAGLPYYPGDDVYPVSRITAASVGEPGRRVFVLQAHFGAEPFSWVIEKEQALGLSRTIPELLAEVREEFPELGAPLVAAQPNLTLTQPLQPLFRVGSIGVSYDRLHDLVVFALVDADALTPGEEDFATEGDEEPSGQHLFMTRGQALLLGEQAGDAVVAGRPLCPCCTQPIDETGHFCLPAGARVRRGGEYMH
jgi:uncharacterized repeat protein (TIGR03847 family)